MLPSALSHQQTSVGASSTWRSQHRFDPTHQHILRGRGRYSSNATTSLCFGTSYAPFSNTTQPFRPPTNPTALPRPERPPPTTCRSDAVTDDRSLYLTTRRPTHHLYLQHHHAVTMTLLVCSR